MKKRGTVLSLLIYLIPILFFIISYFLITTSGEDIHQGANNLANGQTIDIINDATGAFHHSGRITDMYAWSVIDFYNYQFSFGIDTIFRIVDVLMISGTFYLATYFVLGRRPKLQIKDSLIFCGIFVCIIFTMFGRQLYSEFSMIHNYVPLIFVMLLFSIPYFKLLIKNPIKNKYHLLTIFWPLLGFIFGMSTTVTPLAFLLTIIIYLIIKRPKLNKLGGWFYTGLIGLIIGFCISFFLSSGMNNYANNPTTAAEFDYVSIGDFIENPFSTIPQLLFHLVWNGGMVLIPLFILTIIASIFSKTFRQIFTKHPLKKLSPRTKHILLSFSLFIVIHIVGTIQIKSPPRILIPVYLVGVILVFSIFASRIKSKFIGLGIVVFGLVALTIHTVFLGTYHTKIATVLDEIKNSPEPALCFERSYTESPHIPIINLSQEPILVDWGYPEAIYNKDITFCKIQN